MFRDPMQQFHEFPKTHLKARGDLATRREAGEGASASPWQVSDQTGQSHADTSLSKHLLREVHRGLLPFLAPRTPSFVHPMLSHFHWWGRRNVDDLATRAKLIPPKRRWQSGQVTIRCSTIWVGAPRREHGCSGPRAFFRGLFSLSFRRLLLLRVDEGGWRRFQFSQSALRSLTCCNCSGVSRKSSVTSFSLSRATFSCCF